MLRPRPTIADVARLAGISTATVSNALSGRRRVDAETVERVRSAAVRLGYVPDPAAQRLRTGHPGAIALISSMPVAIAAGPSRLGFMMEIAAAAASVALERGVALVLVPAGEGPAAPLDHLDVAGALVVEPVAGDPNVARLLARRIPVVAIGRQQAAPDLPHIDLQSARCAELMLDHLRAEGARRIALFIGAQRRNSYTETEAVYGERAAIWNMPAIVRLLDETDGEQAGYDACRGLLAERPDIDAICAPVDAFAVGALRALRDLGRRVPGEVRLVTRYDGLRARTASPPLTAVNLNLDEVSRRAVERLLRILFDEEEPDTVSLTPQTLLVRGSSRKGS